MRYGKYVIERRPRKCPTIDESKLVSIGLTKEDIGRLSASKAGKELLRSYLATNEYERNKIAGKRDLTKDPLRI